MAQLTDKSVAELPKEQGPEQSLPGKPVNQPGVYEHKAASAVQGKPVRLIVLPDATTNAQADALVRMGYEWVGPPPSRVEIAQMQADQLKADQEAEAAGVDPTAVQQNAPDPDAVIFNGSSDRQGAADKAAALNATRVRAEAAEARAEAAEAALAELSDMTKPEPEESTDGSDSTKTKEEGN